LIRIILDSSLSLKGGGVIPENTQFGQYQSRAVYDIPWNPVRLEQRVGRIHRYGQEKDCLIINFVAQNTREGRVLKKLLERLKEIREDLGTDQVFDVVGEVFPANRLEQLLRQMYARQTDEHRIQEQIVRDCSPERFRSITESTLEGLAKRELNLSAIVGRSAEAKERRLVPEVIEQFFVESAPETGLRPKPAGKESHCYRVGKLPRQLVEIGNQQENRFGRIGRDYGNIVFDKRILATAFPGARGSDSGPPAGYAGHATRGPSGDQPTPRNVWGSVWGSSQTA